MNLVIWAVVAVAAAAGLALRSKAKAKAPATPGAPGFDYEAILCEPYKGHNVCLYRFTGVDYKGDDVERFDASIDGGAMLEGTEAGFMQPDDARWYARAIIDGQW